MFTIKSDRMQVTVAAKAAELQSVLGCDGTEYLWQGDGKYWEDRAPTLFPFIARLLKETYRMDGREYSMKIHGFAPYSVFSAKEHTENKLVLELAANEETRARYPREFAFRVVYELRENLLEITYEVENRDERWMYFGVGGHPGFRVPLAEGKKFEDYRLRFVEKADSLRVGFTPDCYITGQDAAYPMEGGNVIRLRHDLFDEDAVVLRDMPRQVTLETEGDGHYVTVRYPDMPYLGIWHRPRTDAPYVCIEPWSSLPGECEGMTVFEEREDLICLEAGKIYRNSWSIEIG